MCGSAACDGLHRRYRAAAEVAERQAQLARLGDG
jgi:hypothetical protein